MRGTAAPSIDRSSRSGRGDSVVVDVAHDLAAWEAQADEYDALCQLKRRPDPFGSCAFLRAYTDESEFFPDGRGRDLLLCSVRESGRLIGHVALRRTFARVGPAPLPREPRLDLLVTHDHDAPSVVARPEDEDRVASTIVAHLATRRDWRLLEWRAQPAGSALARASETILGADGSTRVRAIPIEPYSEVPLLWSDVGGYFHALSKRMRSNVSRQVRRLYASGDVELLLAEGTGVGALLPLYLDLEQRSWKRGTDAAMARSTHRVRFFERMTRGAAGLEPSFAGVVRDGVVIAALISGSFAGTSWAYEMAFDESYAELGPGQLLLLLAAHEAIGKGVTSLQFFQNFGYYKHRWLANDVEVVNVQAIRRPSLHAARAWFGERRRASLGDAEGGDRVDGDGANPAKDRVSTVSPNPASVAASRSLVAAARAQAGVRVVGAADAGGAIPFPFLTERAVR